MTLKERGVVRGGDMVCSVFRGERGRSEARVSERKRRKTRLQNKYSLQILRTADDSSSPSLLSFKILPRQDVLQDRAGLCSNLRTSRVQVVS